MNCGRILVSVLFVTLLASNYSLWCVFHNDSTSISNIRLDDTSSVSEDEIRDFNVTWVSLENPSPTTLSNNTSIIGNAINVSAIVEDAGVPELEVVNITTFLYDNVHEIIYQETDLGNSSHYSIPWLSFNFTASLNVSAKTNNGTTLLQSYEQISFNNTFTPTLSNLELSADGAIITLSWDVYDANIGDLFSFDVLLSSDGGETFQLIVSDLNDTEYVWDSTGYLLHENIFEIRVTDSKGLTDRIQYDTSGTTSIPPPLPSAPALSEPDDLVFYQGAVNVEIAWSINSSYSVEYKIWRNGSYIKSGDIVEGFAIVILDDLEPGIYEFTIQVTTPFYLITDSVFVHVLESPIPMIIGALMGIGFGCIVLFLVAKKMKE